MTRLKIVLYNPRADFFTMPLALVALASALDRKRFDVRIIDGRLEKKPAERVVRETKDALCLGVTVLTGAPLRDALAVSRAVKLSGSGCPIVWGGWHPSLFPAETLDEAGIDAAVQGQGEHSFVEIVERLAAGASLDGVAGCTSRGSVNPPRAPVDLNTLAAHDYGLIPVESYFRLKAQRQLDYITSQGCRFRCTFCADPTVYGRTWSGLVPERIGSELAHLTHRYGVEDVGFQDETFFTQEQRVAAIADELLRRDLELSWMATMRGDQGSRLDDKVLALCRKAGLRRVMIGLESGSQQMLDWMKKDVTVEQVLDAAEKCRRVGIGALFNLIVGFPHESPESVHETLQVAKRLRAMGPDFQVAIFYYKPYPGTEITDMLEREGHRLPRSLGEWAELDKSDETPWVSGPKKELIERFKFFQQVAWARPTALRAPLQSLARWRCRHDFYQWPLEKTMVEWIRPLAPQG